MSENPGISRCGNPWLLLPLEGGGEEEKELTKLESCLVLSFLLLSAWCAYLCVYFLFYNCPMLGTLFGSIHALSPPHSLDPSLLHMSIAETKALDKLEGF